MAALDATLAQEDAAWGDVSDYIFGRGTPEADLRTNYWSDDVAAVTLAEIEEADEEIILAEVAKRS